MDWRMRRKAPFDDQIYYTSADIKDFLQNAHVLVGELRSLAKKLKEEIPVEIFDSNMAWLENELRAFGVATLTNPEWPNRVYFNIARGTMLQDGVLCLECCNTFVTNIVPPWHLPLSIVVVSRGEGQLINVELMNCSSLLNLYSKDIWHTMVHSMEHYDEHGSDHSHEGGGHEHITEHTHE